MRPAPRLLVPLLAGALALGARAETANVTPSGFLVTHRHEVSAPPRAVYEALGRVGEWWNGEHTYSGNAGNLTLPLAAPGCFCERWEGNSIEHGRVIYAHRDKALRIEGALGPLQPMAALGILDFALAPSERGTALTVTYRVRAADGSLDRVAAVVDRVIGEQARRLAAYTAPK